MKLKELNLNREVFIKLNERGFARLAEEYNRYARPHNRRTDRYYKAEAARHQGWYKIQLWELMQVFGDVCYNGAPLCFEMDIRIPEESLKEV